MGNIKPYQPVPNGTYMVYDERSGSPVVVGGYKSEFGAKNRVKSLRLKVYSIVKLGAINVLIEEKRPKTNL